MFRFLKLVVTLIILGLAAFGAYSLKKQSQVCLLPLGSMVMQSQIQQSAQKLNDSQTITKSLGPAAQTVGASILSKFSSDLSSAATPGGQKISANNFVDTIKKEIGDAPIQVAEQARYEYCKQVIEAQEHK